MREPSRVDKRASSPRPSPPATLGGEGEKASDVFGPIRSYSFGRGALSQNLPKIVGDDGGHIAQERLDPKRCPPLRPRHRTPKRWRARKSIPRNPGGFGVRWRGAFWGDTALDRAVRNPRE